MSFLGKLSTEKKKEEGDCLTSWVSLLPLLSICMPHLILSCCFIHARLEFPMHYMLLYMVVNLKKMKRSKCLFVYFGCVVSVQHCSFDRMGSSYLYQRQLRMTILLLQKLYYATGLQHDVSSKHGLSTYCTQLMENLTTLAYTSR